MTRSSRGLIATALIWSLIGLLLSAGSASAAVKHRAARSHTLPRHAVRHPIHRSRRIAGSLVLPISQGRPAAASSNRSAGKFAPVKGNDGLRRTSWLARSNTFPQWWSVDLGASRALGHVRIVWRSDQGQAYGYLIQGSNDGVTWIVLHDGTGNTISGTTDDVVAGSFRYVRVAVTSATAAARAGFWECKVYGAADTPSPPTPVEPTPSPSATTTAEPTPTPTPTATATGEPAPTPTGSLLWTSAEIAAVRADIAAGQAPYAAAWAAFKAGDLAMAMSSSANVVAGPVVSSGSGSPYDTQLGTDGSNARSAGIAYALTGTIAYAQKTHDLLMAWVEGNHPSTYADMGDVWGGTYIGSGLFSMAFGYDLTKASSVYSSADKAAITAWFALWATDLQTFMDAQAADPIFKNPNGTHPYYWASNPGLTYNQVDYYTGGDCPGRTTPGELAAAIEGDNTTILAKLFDPNWTLAVPNIIRAASAPRNSGDNHGTTPVPQVQIFKEGALDNPGRGGNVDYMTYNERESTLLYELAANLGKGTPTELAELKVSWTYLSRFFGPDAQAPVAPDDTIDTACDLARMQMAYHLFGGANFAADVAGQTNLREVQFLGPTILVQPAP